MSENELKAQFKRVEAAWQTAYKMQEEKVQLATQTYEMVNELKKKLIWALPKKIFKKKLKYTDAGFVQNCLGIPKRYAACLSDVSPNENNFLKLARSSLKSQTGALKFSGLTRNVFQQKRHLCVILTFNMKLTVFTKTSGQC